MTTKKDIKKKVVKASPKAKSIDKPTTAPKVDSGKKLRLEVKIQTAEGWKRDMRKQHPLKKVEKIPKPEKPAKE